MGYRQIIENEFQNVYNASIATKIIQHMDRVRDNKTEDLAKRWVWELIQNAKDVAYKDKSVKVKIKLHNDKLEFSHNGQPFKVKNILSIINQVSSKKPDEDSETTGKFGTGFVTTHLLSEKVSLSGIVQDFDGVRFGGEISRLNAKKFTVLLDRSGHTQEDVMSSINKSIDVISQLDSQPDVVINEDDFNTTFTYELKDESSFLAAKKGIDDLIYSVIYVLGFVKNLSEVIIEDKVNNNQIVYREKSKDLITENISILTVCEINNEMPKEHRLLLANQNDLMLATPINENNEFLQINENVPRIFVDFPLIGSETFPFPVVCNSRNLLPNEPRSWIPLSNKESSVNSATNKSIMKNAKELYIEMIELASNRNFKNYYNALYMSKVEYRDDFDDVWYNEQIIEPMVDKFFSLPVILTKEMTYSNLVSNLYFPSSDNENELNIIWHILNDVDGIKLILLDDVSGWNKSLTNISNIKSVISAYVKLENLTSYAKKKPRLRENVTFVSWVQKVYDAVLQNKELRGSLESGQLEIIPDQTTEVNLHSAYNIYIDNDIDEKIKYTTTILNDITYRYHRDCENIYVYKELVNKDFDTRGLVVVKEYNVLGLVDNIKKRTNYANVYYISDVKKIKTAWCMLISCCNDTDLYEFIKDTLPEEMGDSKYKQANEIFSSDLWYNSIKGLIRTIGEDLNGYKTVENVVEYIIKPSVKNDINVTLDSKILNKKMVTWFNKFFEIINKYKVQLEVENSCIYPNQLGKLKCSNSLNQRIFQDFELDEDIKTVSELISKNHRIENCKEYLLDKRITINELLVQKVSKIKIASEITNEINNVINYGGLSGTDEEMQEACAILLSWIQENPDKAVELFSSFCGEEASMKLLTPKSASILTRANKEFKKLMSDYDFESVEDLELFIKQNMLEDKNAFNFRSRNVEIDYEFLVGLSQEQQMEYARRVGLAGEKACFKWLTDNEKAKGYEVVEETESKCVFAFEDARIQYSLADSEYYKQKGYDILKEVVKGNDVFENSFIEVKTTVSKERKKYIRLSKSQLNLAISEKENYSVMSIHIDKNLEDILDITTVNDILKSINEKKISFTDEVYFTTDATQNLVLGCVCCKIRKVGQANG